MENAEQEFVSVVREYERVIYKVCYLYTTPNATLNDLYQEVVLNLWKAFPKFRLTHGGGATKAHLLGELLELRQFHIFKIRAGCHWFCLSLASAGTRPRQL